MLYAMFLLFIIFNAKSGETRLDTGSMKSGEDTQVDVSFTQTERQNLPTLVEDRPSSIKELQEKVSVLTALVMRQERHIQEQQKQIEDIERRKRSGSFSSQEEEYENFKRIGSCDSLGSETSEVSLKFASHTISGTGSPKRFTRRRDESGW